ncbi:MAG TPA: galactokinase [Flavitalea sp.]|nr:galactokinase [Flavitalea sp.]
MDVKKIQQQFRERFGKEPMIVTAPGRVNLIGEHTDYNEGFVLPGAVDKKIMLAIAVNDVEEIRAYANQFEEYKTFSVHALKPASGWVNYILGVTFHIQQQTKNVLQGLDIIVDGDVPVGGGMSSSAALCSGYGLALNDLFNLGLDRLALARIGQKTEHTFVGAKVGIMDQFASLHGKAEHVIKLDCRSMEYEYIPFKFPDYKIIMVNSMVHHSLASSEYNVRRSQCEEGVRILKNYYPQINSLRDVSVQQVDQHKKDLPDLVYKRCSYVTREKERLLRGCELLKKNDLPAFGKLMYETHEGLSKDYEVSCPELDFLANESKKLPGITGSRMMGGGFGGCTINLVKAKDVDVFITGIQLAYEKKYNKKPEVYITQIEDGAKILFRPQ